MLFQEIAGFVFIRLAAPQ